MDLGDTPGKRCLHHAVATLRLGQGTGTVGFLQFGVGHGHFQVTDGIEFAQVALGVEVLPGHGQFCGGNPCACLGFGAVEAGQHGALGHGLTKRRVELAEGATHLTGKGGFQACHQQYADGAGLVGVNDRLAVSGQGWGKQQGQYHGEQTALRAVWHSAFLAC
ncbi:hypothetical protein D3C77_112480 [compost metagenome]